MHKQLLYCAAYRCSDFYNVSNGHLMSIGDVMDPVSLERRSLLVSPHLCAGKS